MTTLSILLRRYSWVVATLMLVVAMGGTWMTSATATASPADDLVRRPSTASAPRGAPPPRGAPTPAPTDEPAPATRKKLVTGTLNLNTATEEQLMMLPQVGPAKAERIVTWRKKNGGFRRTADLRRVKGFGYKTFKRLEPLLDIRGETTLAPK